LDAGNADLDSTTKHRSSADQDRLIGMLALATVVLVAAGLIALFGIPARQDCAHEQRIGAWVRRRDQACA